MNRANRILAVILVVQIVLAAAVFILPRFTSASAEGAPLLGALTASDITGLTLRDSGSNAVQLVKQGDTWVVPDTDGFPADKTKVEPFLEKVLGITTNPLVTRTSAGHKRLQVAEDDFARRVDLTLADGSTRTLFLGAASTGGGYVRLNGQDDVYVARGLYNYDVGVNIGLWIDATYFKVDQNQITRVTIENANGTLEFEKDASGNWTMKGLAAGETFNADHFTTILTRLSSISMVRPLGKVGKPEYGLDQPTAVVTIAAGDKTYTLRIGAKDESGNTYVLSWMDSPYIVRVSSFTVGDFIDRGRDAYLSPTPTPTAAPAASPTPETSPTPTP